MTLTEPWSPALHSFLKESFSMIAKPRPIASMQHEYKAK